jgi:hypothetical protein
MAGLSFISFDVDAKKLMPVAIIAAVGVAGWLGWQYLQRQQAAAGNAQASAADGGYSADDLANLALLQSVLGEGSGSSTSSTSSVANSALPTYGNGSNAPSNTPQGITLVTGTQGGTIGSDFPTNYYTPPTTTAAPATVQLGNATQAGSALSPTLPGNWTTGPT